MLLGRRIGLSLCFAVLQMVSSDWLTEQSNVQSFKTPKAGAEHQPKCHVRGRWVHNLKTFTLVCYQCNDDQRSIAIYRNSALLDAADVKTCKHYNVAGSVSVVVGGKVSVHNIEYGMTDRTCKLVYYGERKREREEECFRDRRKPNTVSGYYNGWKKVDEPWTTGVVMGVYSTYRDNNCKPIRGWRSEQKPVEMICYDCQRNLVVKIFDNGVEMAIASVGTCRSPDVEDSIDILPPRASGSVFIQFMLYTNACLLRIYRRERGKLEVNNDDCVSRPDKKRALARSTRNGWTPSNDRLQ